MKKFKKIGLSFIFLFAFILVTSDADIMQAAATGYTDHGHSWSSSSDCGGCTVKSGYANCSTCSGKKTCQTCGGKGYTKLVHNTYYDSNGDTGQCYGVPCTSCGGWSTNSSGWIRFNSTSSQCKYLGGSTSNKVDTSYNHAFKSAVDGGSNGDGKCSKCSGTGTTSSTCARCNGKGVNYKCTTSGCTLKSSTSSSAYDYWSTETATPSAGSKTVCYTTENTYTIAFNGNGATSGSTANMSCYYDNAYTLTANGYSRTGYTFLGWSTSSTATTATYANKASVSKLSSVNGATVTLYAVWKANTYSVTYDANGGIDAPAKQDFVFGSKDAISSNEPSRTGYTFINWWATHTTSTYFTPGDEIPASWGSFTLQARWSANSYTITLVPNGGTCDNGAGEKVDSVTTTYDTDMYYCINGFLPTRTGYTFKGWYDALEGGTQVYGPDGFCTNEGTYWKDNKWAYADDVTLYAQWEQNEYTVTYDANGGSTENTTRSYHYNDEVDLSLSAEKEGKIFVGWNTEPNAKVAINTFIMPDLATTEADDNKETTDIIENDWELTLYAIYSIQVSDVANHTYPDYEQVKEQEVFLHIWEYGNESNCIDYPLAYEYDANTMVYRYAMDIDATDFVKDMSAYCYAVYAYDNAGNWNVLDTKTISSGNLPDQVPPDVTPQKYTQTVNHYRYDAILKSWVKFDTTKEDVEKGKTFSPSFVTLPTGYKTDRITYPDGYTILYGSYVVREPATSSAYYKPMDYTLFFDVNASDASVTPTQKTVTYGGRYGELPTPVRKGYSFTGWYTEEENGILIAPSMKYEIPDDSTVYAHWERNSYEVIYDYWTNGGTYASVLSKNTPYGSAVDLSVTATKNGYTFVGWNTNPEATSKLSSLVMEDKELVLYAIYKKDITATFVDSNNGTKRTVTTTVYNNQTEGSIDIPSQNAINGWLSLGWSLSSDAQAPIVATPGTNYRLSEDTTFYGCYVKDITLSYDTNGSGQSFDSETKERYYNAYGNYSNPIFTITAAPTLSEHSFVAWVDKATGDEYQPGENATITVDTLLTARWDAFPVIEAYDRYFTLEEAQNGEITPEKLLEKVIGTDKEDGALINGEDVIVLDYNASDFLNSTEVEITYQATDSFGNTVEKTVTVHVVDTTVKESPKVRYVRFISSRFYADEAGSLLAPEKGGLELTSVWRNNDSYKSVLERVLYNSKENEEYKNINYLGVSTQVKVAGSGEWQNKHSTWVFTKDDIKEVKSFVDTHGYGNIREPNALELFIEAFRKCLKLN